MLGGGEGAEAQNYEREKFQGSSHRVSVLRGFLGVVDDEYLARAFLRFQFEPELLLYNRENGRWRVIGVARFRGCARGRAQSTYPGHPRSFRRKIEFDIECALESGLVDHRPAEETGKGSDELLHADFSAFQVVGTHEEAAAGRERKLTWRRGWWRFVGLEGNATTLFGAGEFWSVPAGQQRVYRHLFRLAVNLQLKTAFQQRLQHRAAMVGAGVAVRWSRG